MTIQVAYKTLLAGLFDLYNDREAENIANWVIEHVTGLPKIERIVNRSITLNQQQQLQLQQFTTALQQNKPVQYVLNEAWFCNMKLFVNEYVLIPRPETEELVDWVVTDIRNKQPRSQSKLCLLDVGTGSGCIAIALKKQLPAHDVMAIDISDEALAVAARNADDQNVVVETQRVDFLSIIDRKGLAKFDFIISNPPYIKQEEAAQMESRVKDQEPTIALFVPDNDPLVFYAAIADFAHEHLSQQGAVYVEVNEALAGSVADLFTQQGYTRVEVKKDMQNKDRMVKVCK